MSALRFRLRFPLDIFRVELLRNLIIIFNYYKIAFEKLRDLAFLLGMLTDKLQCTMSTSFIKSLNNKVNERCSINLIYLVKYLYNQATIILYNTISAKWLLSGLPKTAQIKASYSQLLDF